MAAFYNEIDPYAAQWLRNLIASGHIAPGIVDERSIEDVRPDELAGFEQCHFFAGIGIWSYALRAAGISDDTPLWTGSCPCQPFSAAGQGAGMDDERHLWPAWFHLIEQRRPAIVFGEQVASKDAMPWIDLVHDDMESMEYAFGAVPFPSAGVGAPHIRDRLYWAGRLAHADGSRGASGLPESTQRQSGHARVADHGGGEHACASERSALGGLEHSAGRGFGVIGSALEPGSIRHADGASDAPFGLADAERERHDRSGSAGSAGSAGQWRLDASGRSAPVGGMADSDGGHAGAEREQRGGEQRQQPQDDGTVRLADAIGGLIPQARRGPIGRVGQSGSGEELGSPGPVNGHWRIADWLYCRDGKWRPVEPGTFPLASIPARGVGPEQSRLLKLARSNRVGRLRGYGNGINADAARIFIEAVMAP